MSQVTYFTLKWHFRWKCSPWWPQNSKIWQGVKWWFCLTWRASTNMWHWQNNETKGGLGIMSCMSFSVLGSLTQMHVSLTVGCCFKAQAYGRHWYIMANDACEIIHQLTEYIFSQLNILHHCTQLSSTFLKKNMKISRIFILSVYLIFQLP